MRSISVVVAALVSLSCSDTVSPGGGMLSGLGDACGVTACHKGLACDPATKICVGAATAADGDACTLGAECQSGQCQPNGAKGKCGPAGAGIVGDGCRGDADCSSGLRCGFDGMSLFPKCVTAGTGDVGKMCTASQSCAQGLFCAAGVCAQVPVQPALAPFGFPPIVPDPTLQWQGASCPPDTTSPVKALFELPRDSDADALKQDFFRLPFPNDAARAADGTLDFSRFPRDPSPPFGFDALGRYLDVLKTEPFGNYGTVIFRFDGPVGFGGFGITGADPQTRVVDLTAGPRFGNGRGISYQLHGGRNHYVCNTWFAVRPFTGDAMEPGTYAVVLLKGVKDLSNGDVQQSPDFTAMLAGSAPADARLTAAYAAYAPLRQYLTMKSITPDSVLVASVFTVGDGQRLVKSLQQSVAALPVPAADPWVKCGGALPSPCPDATGPRACGSSPLFDEWHSLVELPIFQQGTAPYLSPDQGGNIDADGGVLAPTRMEKVCAALTVPKAAAPATGWPLVLYAHGTGGSYRLHADDGSGAALAAVALDGGSADGGALPGGYAVLGFDQVGHGPRRGDAGQSTSPNDIVFNFANPASARGTMAQGTADLIGVAAYAKALSGSDAGLPPLDSSRLVFWGHSQGSTEGAMFLAVDRSVVGAVLSGASASLTDALLSKKSPVDIADVMWVALDESQPSDVDAFHPVLSLLQTWTDVVDPVNFARNDIAVPADGAAPAYGRNVFQVWGKYDTFTAQPVQSTFAQAAGLAFVGPKLDDFDGSPVASAQGNYTLPRPVTAAMRQYEPGDGGYDGHFVVFFNDQARRDAVRFIVRSASGDVPLVPEP